MHEFLHFYVGTLLHFYASIYIRMIILVFCDNICRVKPKRYKYILSKNYIEESFGKTQLGDLNCHPVVTRIGAT